MSNERLDVWIWVLVYGGLLMVCLGLFVQRANDDQGQAGFGIALIVAGALLAAIGAFGVWLRAQRGP